MRRSFLFIALSWVLLPPGGLQPVRGQSPDGACLEPVPRLYPSGPFSSNRQEQSGPLEDPPLFISSGGQLCQAFQFKKGIPPTPQLATEREIRPGRAFLMSAILPGAGQWHLGQDRWPAYLAVELWAWIQFLDWRREGHDLQTQYKDLAWLVARRVSTGLRTDAGWEYYEALSQYQSSGAYDKDPIQPGIQPEEDPNTFNGTIWALAQGIFLPEDPEVPLEEGSEPYEKAYSYYASRAYGSGLAWDWGTNTLHQREYAALIRDSDEALRSSTGMIGVILANHLLSAVDALVSGRLGIAGRAQPSFQFLMAPGPFGTRAVAFHVRLPDPLTHGF